MATLFASYDAARDPAEVRDFVIQLTAGRVADRDGARSLYSVEAQRLRQGEILGDDWSGSDLLPFNHPPFLLPVLRPLSRLPMRIAYLVWTAGSGLLFLLSSWLLVTRLLPPRIDRYERLTVTFALLSFFPVGVALYQGQDTALLFAGVAGWAILAAAQRDFTAGLLLSLAAIRPHLLLTFAAPFLFARRRVLAGSAVGAILLFALSWALIGWEGFREYAELLRLTGGGSEVRASQSRMPNLLGLLSRTFPAELAGTARGLAWVTWGSFLATCSIRWKREGDRVSSRHVAVLILGGAFLVPHIHLHDLSVVAVPAVLAAWALVGRGAPDWNRPLLALCASSFALGAATTVSGPLFDVGLLVAVLLLGTAIRTAFPSRLSNVG